MGYRTGTQYDYLAEITYYTTAQQTEYVSVGGFISKSTDSPANQPYDAYLKEGPIFSRSGFLNHIFGDIGEVDNGFVTLQNMKGRYDGWLKHGLAGWPIVIKRVVVGAALSTAETLITAITEYAEFVTDDDGAGNVVHEVRLFLKDKQTLLEESPVSISKFGGTSTSGGSPYTKDGDENQEGKPWPMSFGYVLNATPAIGNLYDHVYQWSHARNGSLTATKVYIDGVESSLRGPLPDPPGDGDLSTEDEFDTQTPASLTVHLTWDKFFKTSTDPGGVLTFSTDFYSSVFSSYVHADWILEQLLTSYGPFSASDLSTIITNEELPGSDVGFYSNSSSDRMVDIVNFLLQSLNYFWFFSRSGILTPTEMFDPASPPSGTNIWTLNEDPDIVSVKAARPRTPKNGQPVHSIIWKYQKNYTVQELPENASTEEWRAFVKEEWRHVIAEDSSVLTKYPEAAEIEVESALASVVAAQSYADDLLALLKVKRYRWLVAVPISWLYKQTSLPDIGDVVTMTYSRYEMDSGVNHLLLSITENHRDNTAELELWG
jgi:hypothetical protein